MKACASFSPHRVAGVFEIHSTLRQRELAELQRALVSEQAMLEPSPVGAAYISWTAPGEFVFEEQGPLHAKGERAFLFLVTDATSTPVDIIAWQPCARDRLGSWRGACWGLGQDRIYDARLTEDDALPVWRSPLDWLRANRRGVVLIQPRLAADWLCDAGPLLAEDREHALELRRLLSRPAPRILFPADDLRAA